MRVTATLKVNGVASPVEVEPHWSLLRAVREAVGLTGAKEGCDDSECGACMMLLDDEPVNACSYLALQAEGREITTVEGLAPPGQLSALQQAFLEHGGVQCGFCTPGMLISATALLRRTHGVPSEQEVRVALAGNLCRCTGYSGIVQAVRSVAQAGARGDGGAGASGRAADATAVTPAADSPTGEPGGAPAAGPQGQPAPAPGGADRADGDR